MNHFKKLLLAIPTLFVLNAAESHQMDREFNTANSSQSTPLISQRDLVNPYHPDSLPMCVANLITAGIDIDDESTKEKELKLIKLDLVKIFKNGLLTDNYIERLVNLTSYLQYLPHEPEQLGKVTLSALRIDIHHYLTTNEHVFKNVQTNFLR